MSAQPAWKKSEAKIQPQSYWSVYALVFLLITFGALAFLLLLNVR
jgi:hypothetical protein